MKHLIPSILASILSLFWHNSFSQELKMVSFNHLEKYTTARINKVEDVNGQNCALVILKYNFNEFEVKSGKGIEKMEQKTGERYLWLSPDEYQLIIRKEGYIPFTYDLKDKLKGLETYELVLTDEYGSIKVEAPNSQIWLDNKLVASENYLFRLKEGKYSLKATRDKYYSEEEFVILNAGENLEYRFNLKPQMGNLVISTTPMQTLGADIFINGELSQQKSPATIPLMIGNYSLKLSHKGYLPFQDKISISTQKNTVVNATLQIDPFIMYRKQRNKKDFWITSTVLTLGSGIFSYLQSKTLYNSYSYATDEATSLHKKIETYDKITPIAFGVSGLCFIEFVIHASKQNKAKQKLNLYTSYHNNSALLSVNYNF